ncbi:MAG: transcriptional regulator MraZ [Spirochaetaceae bacterium]|nr:MAG: transcriptional regulator MraZ [Spirochaetaceae bacterium]
MITGQYHNALDEKGRLSVPQRIRAEITGNVLVITRGIDACLWLFPPEEWKTLSDSLMSAASPFTKKARLMQRRIIAPAVELEIDKSGRITIPQSLKESAGLTKDCVILGIKKYIEVWDESAYESYLSTNEDEFQEAAEELGGLVSF